MLVWLWGIVVRTSKIVFELGNVPNINMVVGKNGEKKCCDGEGIVGYLQSLVGIFPMKVLLFSLVLVDVLKRSYIGHKWNIVPRTSFSYPIFHDRLDRKKVSCIYHMFHDRYDR